MAKAKHELSIVAIGSIADNAEAVAYLLAHCSRHEYKFAEAYDGAGIIWLRETKKRAAELTEWVSGFAHGLQFAAVRAEGGAK